MSLNESQWNDGTNTLKARSIPHNSDKAIQSTIQNSETFSAHLSALKAAIAILILFIYLHLDPKAVNAPYKIQIIQEDFLKAASGCQEKRRKMKESQK